MTEQVVDAEVVKPAVPDTNPPEKPKLMKLIDIAVGDDQKVYVNWPVDKKELCITALAEAVKLVANYESKIIKPQPKFMDFVRGIKK